MNLRVFVCFFIILYSAEVASLVSWRLIELVPLYSHYDFESE